MKTRIWRKSFSIRRRFTLRHVLQLERLEDRLNLSTVLGTAGDDTLVIEATGLNGGNYSLNGAAAVVFSNISTFHFDGLNGNDLLQIKHPAGGAFAPSGGITYDGGEGFDGVEVIGGGDGAGNYAPGATSDSGTITVSASGVESTLRFTGLEPSTISGLAAFTFTTPNSDDVLTIDSPGAGQNRISGTSGGMPFEALTFFDITNFTVDTGTNDGALPDDQITIDASGLVASGLINFTVSSGAGADSLTILATNYSTPGSVSGVAFQGGTETDTFIGNADIGYTLNNGGVTTSGGGTVAFTSVDQANLTGGASANTFNVNSNAIVANLAGGGGNDTFKFGSGANLSGGTIDGGLDNDTLDYSDYNIPVAVNLGSNVSSLGATLQGDQEVPANASTATGTATITYSNTAHTIDISLSVNGIAPTNPGLRFHVHRAPIGVNGPIIVDLFNATPSSSLGTLTPTGPTSFTFTATGVPLDPLHEAALLGGITYFNVHTAAFAGGEIRGQIFPDALFAPASGRATGTAGVSNMENATGGAASFTIGPTEFGDSIVGNLGANVLRGGAGNDVIIGSRGDDTVEGGLAIGLLGLTTGNALVSFNAHDPGTILATTPIIGLAGGENVVGIDIRPATGQLYGVTDQSNLYVFNAATGAATLVAPLSNAVGGGPVILSGTAFGVDFNPTVDRLRVVSDADQNLRINPANGVTNVDLPLVYDDTTADGDAIDPNAGANPNVVGVAYTNNLPGATGTTLFDIDSALDILATQIPPNNGVLNTVGPLGVNTSDLVGFDILGANTAVASLTAPAATNSTLYTINLATGTATVGGAIAAAPLRGLTVASIGATGIVGPGVQDNDILVWSNGDGSDVMDGGPGTDLVSVNGNPTAADVFTVDAGPAGRVDFERISPAGFTLDIGTTETMSVNGIGGGDTFTVNSLTGVADLATVNLNGLDGNDTFNVTPAASVTVNVAGHQPRPGVVLLTDTLNVDTTGTMNPTLTAANTPSGFEGNYTFGDRSPVNFSGIESLGGVPTVSVSDAAAPEGEPVVFTLTLSQASTQQVTVRVNTTSGTATGDVDYNQINSFFDVVFPPGETMQTISVSTFEDTADEPDETFFLNVLRTTNAAVADGQGVGTIVDNPTVSVGDAAADEGDAVVFTLTLSAPSNQQVTVRVNTSGGTATGDVDYNEINSFNDIIFPPGETMQTISVQTFEDALSEPDETFFLNVLQTTNAAVADGQGIGTINDDDISVSVDSNGKLLIEGTSQDDIVTITGIPPGVAGSGMYLVTTQAGSQVPQTQTVIGVTGDICVNLHAGNDQLTMNNAYVNGSIIIDMEAGNDAVTLGNADVVSTRANLDVDLGTENDVLNGRRIFIAGDQILAGGDGNDTMTFNGFASPFTLGTSAAGNANWSTGNGDDTVQVIYAFIVGSFTIDLGVGTDSLNIFGSAASGNVTFVGGVGNDSLTVDTNFFDASLLLDGGGDNDTVFLANGLGIDIGTINTGAGDDTVTVRNETQVRATIDTGSGNDTVDVRSSAVDRFFALLGDDDDELTLFGNLLRIEADLDGGAGSADRLIDLGNDVRGALRTRNFELFG